MSDNKININTVIYPITYPLFTNVYNIVCGTCSIEKPLTDLCEECV